MNLSHIKCSRCAPPDEDEDPRDSSHFSTTKRPPSSNKRKHGADYLPSDPPASDSHLLDTCHIVQENWHQDTPRFACNHCFKSGNADSCDSLAVLQRSLGIKCGSCEKHGRRGKCQLDLGSNVDLTSECRSCSNKQLSCDLVERLLDQANKVIPNRARSTDSPFEMPAEELKDLIDREYMHRTERPPPFRLEDLPLSEGSDWLHQILRPNASHHLVLGHDWGTRNSAINSGSIEKAANKNLDHQWRLGTTEIDTGRHQIPTQAQVVANGRGGYKLHIENDTRLDNSNIGTFRFLKLHLITEDDMRQMGHLAYGDFVRRIQEANNQLLARLKRRQLLPNGIETIEDIILEILRHHYSVMKKGFMKENGLPDNACEWILQNSSHNFAAPAIWTNKMIRKFRQLLVEAGFPQPRIKSEPSLILAVHALKNRGITNPEHKKALLNKMFVLVDIGCGTEDISQLVIDQIEPELRTSRIASGTGSLAGSELLNYYMKELRRELAGDDLTDFARSCNTIREGFLDMLMIGPGGFEAQKRDFDYNSSDPWSTQRQMSFQLPSGCILKTKPGKPEFRQWSVVVRYDQVCDTMDRYWAELVKPIDAQLSTIEEGRSESEEKPRILFAGGGSRIPYLQTKLAEYYVSRGYFRPEFMEGRSRSKVAEGAVIAHNNPEIGSRHFARESYGVPETVEFNPEIHDKSDAEKAEPFHNYRNNLPVENCFVPLTVKNRAIDHRQHEGIKEIDVKDFNKNEVVSIRIDILKCTDPNLATSLFWKIGPDLKRLDPNKVKYAYKIKFDVEKTRFSDLPIYEATRRYGKAVKKYQYHEIKYRIVVVADGLNMVFFAIIHPSGDFPANEGYGDRHYIKDCMVKRLEVEEMEVDG